MDDYPPSRKKILIIRLSSMGDVVLTTPVIRALKQQLQEAEIHFLIKKEFAPVLETNPYITKIHHFTGNISACVDELKTEKFDFVVDLQKNVKSKKIVHRLGTASATYNKHNFQKWVFVRLKVNFLPNTHIVDRYFEAVAPLGVVNDGKGLDFFIPESKSFDEDDLPAVFENGYVAVSLGAAHPTKRIPIDKIVEIGRILYKPMMLLGGKDVFAEGEEIVSQLGERVYNGCGKFSLMESASIIEQSVCLLTGDTGLMHIGAALQVPTASLWGNTVPEFGMYPYMSSDKFRIFEVCPLRCRPCSKLGHKKCPKGHFNCMNLIPAIEVAEWINQFDE
ncbi:MAG: glycosyltransferase family 9 protein [Bacteroidales bacterium]|nr:glycosyltransferase family 9 protein [Bacteroidales bacterium]